MTYGALNTITTTDAEQAWGAIRDVSNVGLLNWQRQSLTCHLEVFAVCYTFSMSFHPLAENNYIPNPIL